jgi:polysaccharide biosynthesis protein PslG
MRSFIIGLGLLMLAWFPLQATDSYYGVQTHFGQFYRADMDSADVIAMLDSVQSAGIQLIRDECYWADVEKTKGVYEFPAAIDFYIAQALERDIRILLILNYNNPHYAAHAGSAVSSDSNRIAFARYCAEVVARYAPLGITLYEIWNEPNIPIFWDPTPDATDYAALLKQAYPSIKAVNPNVTVLGCATSPAEGNPAPFIDWLTFISGVYQQGGGDYMDGVSFHLYRFGNGPEYWLFNDIQKIQNIVGQEKSLWITEIGYPTSQVWPAVPLQTQANHLSRLYLLGRTVPQLKTIIYYDLKNDGQNPNDNEHNFGLLYFNLAAKPAFYAIKSQRKRLEGLDLLHTEVNGANYSYRFGKDTQITDVVWNASSATTYDANLSQGRAQVLDRDGQMLYYTYNKDGRMDVEVNQAPLYFRKIEAFPHIQRFHWLPDFDTLVVGQQYRLNLQGETEDSFDVLIADGSCIDWQLSGYGAAIDSSGLFSAVDTGSVLLNVSFDGYVITRNFTIIEPFDYREIESFNSLGRLTWTMENLLPESNLSITDSAFTTPDHALRVDYSLKYIGSSSHRINFDCDYQLFGEPDSLIIDVCNNGQKHYIKYYLQDRDQNTVILQSAKLGTTTGWQRSAVFFRQFGSNYYYPARLKGITLILAQENAQKDSVYSGQFLLDNLRIHHPPLTAIDDTYENRPLDFRLFPNYPNPFNPRTTISYSLAIPGKVELNIFNTLGQKVATLVSARQPAGTYALQWEATGFASGVYYCQLRVDERYRQIRKLVLLK